jgi:hypothetical protein
MGEKMTMKEKKQTNKQKPNRHYAHSSSCLVLLDLLYVKRNEKEQSTPQTTTKYTQNKK